MRDIEGVARLVLWLAGLALVVVLVSVAGRGVQSYEEQGTVLRVVQGRDAQAFGSGASHWWLRIDIDGATYTLKARRPYVVGGTVAVKVEPPFLVLGVRRYIP